MKKTKDGKIVASLTEVKNRTGDIFSLVDEYGEITLTSHSRPKYKIIKISLNEYINLEYETEDMIFTEGNNDRVSKLQEVQNKNNTETGDQYREIGQKSNSHMNSPLLKTQLVEKDDLNENHSISPKIRIDVSIWNRNSPSERKFSQLAIRPLI